MIADRCVFLTCVLKNNFDKIFYSKTFFQRRCSMLTAIIKWSVFIYGILLIALGIVGYTEASSVYSLLAGAISGCLLILCACLMFMNKRIGLLLATLVTLLMTGCFAYRYSETHGLLPALLAVLSGAMLIMLFLNYARWKKG